MTENTPTERDFDYVVVGGGSAGAPWPRGSPRTRP